MTDELLHAPAARTWRDIPQPVKTRAMSRGGRWRLAAAALRTLTITAVIAGVVGGVALVVIALQENPKNPAATRAVPVRHLELTTSRDGVLTDGWLATTLALPRDAALLELDLDQLRAKLLADGQILTASLTKRFPDTLRVSITERAPVARVMAQIGQREQPLLVARDGVVFAGDGYEAAFLDSLPWLDGVTLKRAEAGFEPIQGIEAAADLMAKARLETERLYRRWKVVSLARLASDREIEVRTADNVTVIFDANGEFLRQLARLDFMWDQITSAPLARATVNLALGRDVPVMLERAAPGAIAGGPGKTDGARALIHLPRGTPPADAPAGKPTPAAPASTPGFTIRLP